MIDRLYVARGDKTFGPFSAGQLRGLAAAGQLRPTDSVWREGAMEKSVFAAKVKNLFPSPRANGEVAGAPETRGPTPSPLAGGSSPSSHSPLVPSELAPAPSDVPVKPGKPSPAAVRTDSARLDSPALLSAIDQTSQGGEAPKEKAPRPPPEPARKRRAVALKGAIILSQDGVTVQYRKKCTQCGFEDRCRSSMPIGNGMTRIHFYCPECRKGRDVQVQGIML